MEYKVVFTKKSLKCLLNLPKEIRSKIINKLKELSVQVYTIGNVKKLSSEESCYRLRVGDYRVVYIILDKELVITVIKIAHRKEVYK